jgi:hypothetical protein
MVRAYVIPTRLSFTQAKPMRDCGMTTAFRYCLSAIFVIASAAAIAADPDHSSPLPKAFIDGTGPGWNILSENDFVAVNGATDTWRWKDGVLHCTGSPKGVLRTRKEYTNFELVVQWMHLESGGNSGLFVWSPESALRDLQPGHLPRCGIEVQILDHGYVERFEKTTGKKATNFTTNGDIFPYGTAKMTPYPPTSPNGLRSFPRKNLSKGFGEWNHYYVRAVNAEIRLWVNGEEVSACQKCDPHSGFLCLEAEDSPVEFRELRIRELP